MLYVACFTVQTVLSEGGVPQRPVVFVSRPELVNRIREKLYQLQNGPGWVTVFGMAGSGKSVLAAEAARHHGLIEGTHTHTHTLILQLVFIVFETRTLPLLPTLFPRLCSFPPYFLGCLLCLVHHPPLPLLLSPSVPENLFNNHF